MKTVILCGGLGTRLRGETEVRPKPLVEIAGRPILWHIMKTYAHYGHTDFVLCLGYKGEMIKNYFYHYELVSSDFSIELGTGKVRRLTSHDEAGWRVTLVDTGLYAHTGARVKRIQRYTEGDSFMLTYGDGVTDLNINSLIQFHQSHGKIGTVTGVMPPSRYGELGMSGDRVVSFREKPAVDGSYISGGYFVFRPEFFDYLLDEDSCVLEREPLERLAADGELMVYTHKGFWQCMDTPRDLDFLNDLCKRGTMPWKV